METKEGRGEGKTLNSNRKSVNFDFSDSHGYVAYEMEAYGRRMIEEAREGRRRREVVGFARNAKFPSLSQRFNCAKTSDSLIM